MKKIKLIITSLFLMVGCDSPNSDLEFRESICGNSIIEFPEECDDGNDPSPSCTEKCLLPVCGDGFLNSAKEQCDDSNLNEFDECSNSCELNRTVFLTHSPIGLSNFGGLEIADKFCQAEASEFDLKGNFAAWLSDDNPLNAPKFRFNSENFTSWYVLVNEFPVAKGWLELTTAAELLNPINVEANGFENDKSLVWTATNVDGTRNEKGACGNWNGIQTGPEFKVLVGKSSSINHQWTENIESCSDGISKKLYCFQVD